jgi:hypothetical protein
MIEENIFYDIEFKTGLTIEEKEKISNYDAEKKNFNIVSIFPAVVKLTVSNDKIVPNWIINKQYQGGVKKYEESTANPWSEKEIKIEDDNIPF